MIDGFNHSFADFTGSLKQVFLLLNEYTKT